MKTSGRSVDQFVGYRKTETSQNQSVQGDNFFGDTQQTIQSYNQQTMSFNNNNNNNKNFPQMDPDKFKMSDNYSQIFKEINVYMDDIKKSSENNEDMIKDMQSQSEKLGSAISYLRQFMFMHNIYFDNSKFLNEQQQQSEYESSTLQRSNNKPSGQIANKSQQKNPQQQGGNIFQNKSKMSQIGNTSAIDMGGQKRDKSPINTNQQSQFGAQNNQQFHQSSQQSQQNPPSKLSGMLSSILQERKSKTGATNNKSGIISTKKNF